MYYSCEPPFKEDKNPETTLLSVYLHYTTITVLFQGIRLYILLFLPRLLQITIPAKHLQILRNSLAACVPGRDVIGMHSVEFKMFLTNRTDSILFGISSSFLTIGKCSDAENFSFRLKDTHKSLF